jgi:translin
VDLTPFAEDFQRRLEAKMGAREKAFSASRGTIRSSANAIRAIHRREFDEAHRLMDEAEQALEGGRQAVRTDHPDVFHGGFLQDAEKEFAESKLTEALVTGSDLPGPEEVGVDLAPYLNGMAEAIVEGRRAVLDLLRKGDLAEAERILRDMDDMHHVLASMDFPDAMTGNLRRSTDAARAIIERTRGDLTVTLVQSGLRDALERHGEALRGTASDGGA